MVGLFIFALLYIYNSIFSYISLSPLSRPTGCRMMMCLMMCSLFEDLSQDWLQSFTSCRGFRSRLILGMREDPALALIWGLKWSADGINHMAEAWACLNLHSQCIPFTGLAVKIWSCVNDKVQHTLPLVSLRAFVADLPHIRVDRFLRSSPFIRRMLDWRVRR